MNALVQKVLDQLIHEIETGTSQWRKSWAATGGMPSNATTNREYQGINVLMLWLKAQKEGFTSNEWATLKQWQAAGYRIKDEEIRKNTTIFFYKTFETEKDGETVSLPIMRCSWVFNADQVEGRKRRQPAPPMQSDERHRNCEAWFEKSGIRLSIGEPAYSPTFDTISMPPPEKFVMLDDYWSTMFHESVHWTGHKSRLDRDLKSFRNDKEAYAFEELIAEIGSAFMDAKFGISGNPMQEGHGAYLRHWLSHFTDRRRAILKAATAANKAVQFLTKAEAEELAEAA